MITFKQFRDGVQHLTYFVYTPFVNLLVKLGVTPNFITTLGLIGNIISACMFAYAGLYPSGEDYRVLAWAGVVMLFSSIFDMIDGHLARMTNQCTAFGAFYDSILDRYCELFVLCGVIFYFIGHNFLIGIILTMLSIIGSIMVSYVRARAEGIGVECKVGFCQRPERVIGTSVGAMLCGLTAYLGDWVEAAWILAFPQFLIAVLANLTAIVRINHVRKQLKD